MWTDVRSTVPRLWQRFWFAPETALNLAMARVIVASQALWVLTSRDMPALASLPAEVWATVPWDVRARFLILAPSVAVERVVVGIALLSLLCVLAGAWTRVSAIVAALSLYHLAGYQKILVGGDSLNRGFTIAILALVVLSAARCSERLSARRPRLGPGEEVSADYAWPLRLMQIFVAQAYFFGFYGKLRQTGWGWFSLAAFQRQMRFSDATIPPPHWTDLPLRLADADAPGVLILALVLLLEAGFLFGAFTRVGRRVFVPMALAFHVGVLVVMQGFYYSLPHLLLFVNWTWLAERTRLRSAPTARAQLSSS